MLAVASMTLAACGGSDATEQREAGGDEHAERSRCARSKVRSRRLRRRLSSRSAQRLAHGPATRSGLLRMSPHDPDADIRHTLGPVTYSDVEGSMRGLWRRVFVDRSDSLAPAPEGRKFPYQGWIESMQVFVVECYWPGMNEDDVKDTLHRVSHLDGVPSPEGSPLCLGCILVPSEGMALFLFEASGEDVVKRVGRLAEVPFDRIVESALFGFIREWT
jgi:hypothetical protein